MFALSSQKETGPIAVLEAMARGCVVLAPRIGALGEVLTDINSITIRQVDPAGVEATLQKAIGLTEDQILQMRGTALNNVSNGFTWNDIAEKMIGHFNRILRPASRISDLI